MFSLMNKDVEVARFDLTDYGFGEVVSYWKQLDILPYACNKTRITYWIRDRRDCNNRPLLYQYIQRHTNGSLRDFINLSSCVSLNDCFWIKQYEDTLQWKDISPYTNELSSLLQKYSFNIDIPDAPTNARSPEFSTPGTYSKYWGRENDEIYLYKRDGKDLLTIGKEAYCEVLASQVYSALGAGIPYTLVEKDGFVTSKCKLFTNEDVSFVPFDKLGIADRMGHLVNYYNKFCKALQYRKIIICDAITCNIDRHMGNHGVLTNSDMTEQLRIAPGFDYNLALLSRVSYSDKDTMFKKANNCTHFTGEGLIDAARMYLSEDIEKELRKIQGIELKLPFYTEDFTETQAEWLTDLVNQQIDEILK